MSSDHLFLEHLTWEEVDRARQDGVTALLLPIGSTEQHGPHMPLDTDCFIAREPGDAGSGARRARRASGCSSRRR